MNLSRFIGGIMPHYFQEKMLLILAEMDGIGFIL